MRRVLLVSSALALASCGGESGGGGATASVPVVGGATPTPTPPVTSPSPAPTPYPTYAQLTGDQSFKTGCAALSYDFSPPLAVPVSPFGTGLTLGYTASTQTYVVTPDPRNTGLFGTQARSFGPADRDPAAPPTATAYLRTTNGFIERLAIGSNGAGGGTPDYVRGFSLRVPLNGTTSINLPAAQYFCIFGVPTRLDDLPATSPIYTRGGLNGSATNYPFGAPESYAINQSQVTFTVDLSTGRVAATIHMLGALVTSAGTSATLVDLGTYSGAGTISSSGYFSGQITSPNRQIRDATFAGWFFGPQASEAAFSIGFDSLDQTNGRHIIFLGNALALK